MKKTILNTIKYFLLGTFAFTTIFPLVWVIMNSFKETQEIIDSSFTLPSSFNLVNYRDAIAENILQGYTNSLIVSISVVAGTLVIGALASYIMARFIFPGKNAVRLLLVGSLMIPVFATIIPVFGMLTDWNLINKHVGLILPQIAGNLPFAVLVLSSYMSTIPLEMEEAAIVEGCNPIQVFWHVIMPISKPSLASVSIFVFLWSYNDLFSSIIILRRRELMPINVLLTHISSQYGVNYGLMAAVIVVIVMPVLLFYILAQNNIVEGMTSGAVKG